MALKQPIAINSVILGRYKALELLGTGGYSQVFYMKDMKHDRDLAVKVSGEGTAPQPATKTDEFSNVEVAIREIRTMKYIASCEGRGKSLMGLMLDWFFLEKRLAIIFPLFSTSINDFLDRVDRRPFQWDDVVSISFQLVHAVKFLHENRVTHMDIKPHNLMMMCADYNIVNFKDAYHDTTGSCPQEFIALRNPEIKLIDFGSCLTCSDAGKQFFVGITDQYRSPETVCGFPAASWYDHWSVGCTIVEIYSGNALFPDSDLCHAKDAYLLLVEKIIGKIPERWKQAICVPEITPELGEIVDNTSTLCERINLGEKVRVYLYNLLAGSLLQIDPTKRGKWNTILQHPFFGEVNEVIWNNLEDCYEPVVQEV